MNFKCPYYLHNLKKVDKEHLDKPYGKNEYKLHYIYREFGDKFKFDITQVIGLTNDDEVSKFRPYKQMTRTEHFSINWFYIIRVAFATVTDKAANERRIPQNR